MCTEHTVLPLREMSIQIDKPTVQDSGSVGVQEQSRSRPTSHNIGGPATHGFPCKSLRSGVSRTETILALA